MSFKTVTARPTIVPAAYSSGDAIGGMLTFEDVCSAFDPSVRIIGAILIDNAKQSALTRLLLFDRTFTPTADNAPMDPTDADLQNCVGWVGWLAADYIALSDNSVAQKGGDLAAILDWPVKVLDGNTDLYGQLVSYGTPTYVAADDLTVKLLIET